MSTEMPNEQVRADIWRARLIQIGAKYFATAPMLNNSATMKEFYDVLANELCVTISAYVLGDSMATGVRFFRCPLTWWDAFKLQYFSDGMLRRWPAKMREERIECTTHTRVCPHYDGAWKKNAGNHLEFVNWRA